MPSLLRQGYNIACRRAGAPHSTYANRENRTTDHVGEHHLASAYSGGYSDRTACADVQRLAPFLEVNGVTGGDSKSSKSGGHFQNLGLS